MPRPNLNALNVKALVIAAASILLMLGLIFLAQGFIDARDYRQQIIDIVKEKTGKELSIRGNVSVSLLPVPTIYLPGAELRDPDPDSLSPVLTADMISIRTSVLSLFSGKPQIGSIHMDHPVLELARASDHLVYWDWLSAGLLKQMSGADESSRDIALVVENGEILYHATDETLSWQNIAFTGHTGRAASINGAFILSGHKLRFSVNVDKNATTGAMPIAARFYEDDKNQLQVQSTVDWSAENPKVAGQLKLEVQDLMTWFTLKQVEKSHLLDQFNSALQDSNEAHIKLPVTLTADWERGDSDLKMSNIQLQGMGSEGTGTASIRWTDVSVVDLTMKFVSLQYDAWEIFLTGAFNQLMPSSASRTNEDAPVENPLPKNLQLSLDIEAKELRVGSQSWHNAVMQIKLAEAAITVNQLHVDLPGESSLSFFGVVSQGNSQSLRFEGSVETEGKDLRQFLTVFDESAADLPDTAFGEFYVRSNIYLSPEQMRLSEADVKISDLELNGGLVAYYDENPRMEADVRLRDINFDYFRDVWRKGHKEKESKDFFLKPDRTTNFNWLRKLHNTIDLRVAIDDFTFLERKGESASFRVFAKDKQFGIYNVRFNYPGETMEASFSVDVKGDRPAVNLLVNASQINTDYFKAEPSGKPEIEEAPAKPEAESNAPAEEGKDVMVVPQAALAETVAEAPAPTPAPAAEPVAATEKKDISETVPAAPAVPAEAVTAVAPAPPAVKAAEGTPGIQWSKDLIDMSWMEGIAGSFDISIGRLQHNEKTFDSVKLRASLESNMMTFQSLSFNYWGGKCDVTGSIYGGTVPGISVGFTIYSAEMYDILKALTGRENIAGKVSVSGTLAASGVNMLSWISQADAKLVFSGRGIDVNGFNLQGVLDTVSVSRTASDVFNNVPLALQKGTTQMSADGNLNIKNGIIRTPGITLKSGTITGNLTGEVNLVPWTMELSTLFQFPAMTSETIPTMTVRLTGPLSAPRMQTDTSSLEAYVAKRITGK